MTSLPVFSHYPALPPPIDLRLVTLDEHACPYLPGRTAISRAFWAERISPLLYHAFMDAGFRRSGRLIYQPLCRGCRACTQIRVPILDFGMSKSRRRVWRKNSDLIVTIAKPEYTDEKFHLYERYQYEWHISVSPHTAEDFKAFLYDSPVDTIEFTYRDPAGTLLAAGLCDVCPDSLSSVYFYFHPAAAHRNLGTYSALYEIEWAQRRNIPHYYLGYWVAGCGAMEYKAKFQPCELLGTDGIWPRSMQAICKV